MIQILETPHPLRTTRLQGYAQECEDASLPYVRRVPLDERKRKGQVFTPVAIANFMANQFENLNSKKHITLLDPGSGSGALTAAACDILLNTQNVYSVEAFLYENDTQIISLLKANMEHLRSKIAKSGKEFKYHIIKKDFLTENAAALKSPDARYDYIISNPPYYKINKSSSLAKIMNDLVKGQPNIYSFFLALSTNLLKEDGVMTFITPRSFCSGEYFKCFRKWLLSRLNIQKIHMFESRKQPFRNEVLQETIIISAGKELVKQIQISSSKNASFDDYQVFLAPRDKIIYQEHKENIIRIPTDKEELKCLETLDAFPYRVKTHGLKISTGPVVDFRAKEWLKANAFISNNTAPLLWMHNLNNYAITWPNGKTNKPKSISNNLKTKKLLRENSTYVFLKRFSSKEQARRLYAGVYRKNSINAKLLGIENHLNYIWKPEGEMNLNIAHGLAALFNSKIYDKYFRIINGNTQVNASDINLMPMPSLERIDKLGALIKKIPNLTEMKIENFVQKVIINHG